MSPELKKKELSSEVRLLLASVLAMAVIFLWTRFLAPPTPPQQHAPAAAPAPVLSGPPAAPAPGAPAGVSTTPQASARAAQPSSVTPPRADTQERSIVVENDLYRVEFSNRGGVVKSWRLKKYKDDAKPPRLLDLVHQDAAQELGGWPFSLLLDDAAQESAANAGFYQVSAPGAELKAPAELSFEWSDGHFQVTKQFKFDHSYTVQVEIEVSLDGRPVSHGIAWRGGFGDVTVVNPAYYEQVEIFYSVAGKLQNLPHKKLNPPEQAARGPWMTGHDYAGIEDRYFVAAFLPTPGAPPASVSARYWKRERDIQVEGKPVKEPVAEMAAGSSANGPLALRVYVGPKDYDDLKRMNPPLHALVQFGWLEFIADPLFHLLKWLHGYVPNYGWAIVVLTLAINMLLFPLKVRGYRTSQKMQKVAPEIKQIQERYKKYSLRDPKKAEMNKEIMAVYHREGINPVGGCLQMFVQMPIWFGLNQMLRYSIELRHAAWIAWIYDLSAPDRFYVLPVLLGVTMYIVTKMTPVTVTDPTQQSMMKFMPISFAFMFIIFPFSSGLNLYILTSNVVAIAQQWYLNRTHPMEKPAQGARGRKK